MTRLLSAVCVSILALAVLSPAPARAGWNVGTDVGLSYFSPENGDGVTAIGWGGGSALLIPIFQPGLRTGFGLGSDTNELVITSGMQFLNSNGSSVHTIQAMAAYQYNFIGAGRTRPFVNAGVGINVLGDDNDSYSAPVFGFGVGSRQMLANEHGAVRVELRIDHANEFKDSGFTVFPSANVIAVRVGWDLMN